MTGTTKIRVRLRKSPIGTTQRQRETLRGLGLRRIRQQVEVERSPAVLGMIGKVRHLVEVED